MASRKAQDTTTITWYSAKSEKYNGREYYYNPTTNESTWILPDELHPNPNECTCSLSCEDTDRDDHHADDEEEDDTLVVNAVGGSAGGVDDILCDAAFKSRRHLVKKNETNDENQTNRNIGRSVGVLLCLLAICAIVHTWSLKENQSDGSATGEGMVEQRKQYKMQPKAEAEVDHAGLSKAGLSVEAGESTKNDTMGTRADTSREDDALQSEAPTVIQSETSIPKGEDVPDSFPMPKGDSVQDGPAAEGGTQLEQELLPEDRGKKTESVEEKANKTDERVGLKSASRGDTSASISEEVDWDAAVREAVNVTRSLVGVFGPTASFSHPRRKGSDILERLEQQLQEEGYEILRQEGPASMVVMLQETRSKKKRSRRLGGGWYRIW